ncbi:hypothetical protein TNCV_4591441 [Trichonephila clavipes]|nr:hypothetical protein TNCV_4591441 [Trichonephila clavipes]
MYWGDRLWKESKNSSLVFVPLHRVKLSPYQDRKKQVKMAGISEVSQEMAPRNGANRSSRIVTGGKVTSCQASALENPIHARWD